MDAPYSYILGYFPAGLAFVTDLLESPDTTIERFSPLRCAPAISIRLRRLSPGAIYAAHRGSYVTCNCRQFPLVHQAIRWSTGSTQPPLPGHGCICSVHDHAQSPGIVGPLP